MIPFRQAMAIRPFRQALMKSRRSAIPKLALLEPLIPLPLTALNRPAMLALDDAAVRKELLMQMTLATRLLRATALMVSPPGMANAVPKLWALLPAVVVELPYALLMSPTPPLTPAMPAPTRAELRARLPSTSMSLLTAADMRTGTFRVLMMRQQFLGRARPRSFAMEARPAPMVVIPSDVVADRRALVIPCSAFELAPNCRSRLVVPWFLDAPQAMLPPPNVVPIYVLAAVLGDEVSMSPMPVLLPMMLPHLVIPHMAKSRLVRASLLFVPRASALLVVNVEFGMYNVVNVVVAVYVVETPPTLTSDALPDRDLLAPRMDGLCRCGSLTLLVLVPGLLVGRWTL